MTAKCTHVLYIDILASSSIMIVYKNRLYKRVHEGYMLQMQATL